MSSQLPGHGAPPQAPRRRDDEPRVLVVDDVTTDAKQSQAVLEAGGYRVTTESRGDAVLRLARSSLLRCVVSELRIQCAEGPCVIMALKADRHRLPRLRVLAYTRHRSAADLDWALDAGSDAVLYKPAATGVLLREVQRLDATDPTPPPPDRYEP